MKKLIIVSVILIVLVCVGICECIISYHTYTQILNHSDELLCVLKESEIHKDKAEMPYLEIKEKWSEYKKIALIFSNHAAIKDFTQKLNTVEGYIEKFNKEECYVAVLTLKATAEFLRRENIPLLENIL